MVQITDELIESMAQKQFAYFKQVAAQVAQEVMQGKKSLTTSQILSAAAIAGVDYSSGQADTFMLLMGTTNEQGIGVGTKVSKLVDEMIQGFMQQFEKMFLLAGPALAEKGYGKPLPETKGD